MNSVFVRILNRLRFLKHLNLMSYTKVLGRKFYIPIQNGIGFSNLTVSELWMCDLIRYSLSVKEGIFMDVGVNVGQTLIKLRAVDEKRPYVGFEPNPECNHYFNQLVKINKFKDVDLIPVGLFDRDTILTLKLYSDSLVDSSASVIDNFKAGAIYYKMNVPVFEYSHISNVQKQPAIAVIKIDVEGAELEVLTSLKVSIFENKPIIFFEILPAYNKDFSMRMERQNKIGMLLKDLGYDILRIHKADNGKKVGKLEKLSNFDFMEIWIMLIMYWRLQESQTISRSNESDSMNTLNKKVGIVDVQFGENVRIVEPVNLYGCKIGDKCFIGPFTEIRKGAVIGKQTKIQSHSFICDLVTIGENCFIGHGVVFINDHLMREVRPGEIGINTSHQNRQSRFNRFQCTILPVTIADHTVIGAGAVVTKDITEPGYMQVILPGLLKSSGKKNYPD